MEIISLFSGCGGMDLGFKQAGFKIVWANDSDKQVWSTYKKNHLKTFLDTRNLENIPLSEIPKNISGIIGGPPCQSWSLAGNGRGELDPRGGSIFEFAKIVDYTNPSFFVLENVAGLLSPKHKNSFNKLIKMLRLAADKFAIQYKVLNAADFGVPQSRKRVFIIGYRKNLGLSFEFPQPYSNKSTVQDYVYDLADNAIPAMDGNITNNGSCIVPNHEYWIGNYSYIFMSRNRVLSWDKESYTIQANGRHVSIHPQAPKMVKVETDIMKFKKNHKNLYRRLTIRECARLQTFPDNFIFYYDRLSAGYKMVGNAVPVKLSYIIAKQIKKDLQKALLK